MTSAEQIRYYTTHYDVLSIVNLDDWYSFDPSERPTWLRQIILSLHREKFEQNERIIFTLSQGDEYLTNSLPGAGLIITSLVELLNEIDISNFFVVIIAKSDPDLREAEQWARDHSHDPIAITFDWWEQADEIYQKKIVKQANFGYAYNSRIPLGVEIKNFDDREKYLLLKSQHFCIYPWLHLYVEPSGRTFPCCGTIYDNDSSLGNTNQSRLDQIWNNERMSLLRKNMLQDQPSRGCERCYEQERSGFFSMRNSANKHHGRHINKIKQTNSDGTLPMFEMVYWDVRFSNLCNLKCRSCGPSFSSSWYQDQTALAPDYAKTHKALIFAGKYETDLWEQLIDHIDHVEQIYFAGGEPLMMDEHYRILEELERRKKFDVRLIYNTNFTQVKLRDRLVFDYWKKFKSVSVGASLDAMEARGEYIRKGTVWQQVEENRTKMIEICPAVDFYISATLSIMNAWHLPDFHRCWSDQGLIKPRDFNINILTDPKEYRLDIGTSVFKEKIKNKYHDHLAWLSSADDLRRASNGYQSAINFMMATDNSHLLDKFWHKTHQMDKIRNECVRDVLPELEGLV